MKRLRPLALAGSLIAATSCAPAPGKFKTIPLTDIVLMSKQTFNDRNQKIANLEALVDLFFIRMGSESTHLLLRSLGIENPTREDREKINNVVSLKKIIRQVTSAPTLKPELQKKEVEKNFLDVNGAGGVLLSSDGMFISVHHAVEKDPTNVVVEYNSKKYAASCLCWYDSYDAALCKLKSFYSWGSKQDIRFASLDDLQKGRLVEVFGRVHSKPYYQVGSIINKNVDQPVQAPKGKPNTTYFSTITISAYSERGFSGGPVFLKDSGLLVGLTSYGSGGKGPSGAARIDHFVKLMKWYIKKSLHELLERGRQNK